MGNKKYIFCVFRFFYHWIFLCFWFLKTIFVKKNLSKIADIVVILLLTVDKLKKYVNNKQNELLSKHVLRGRKSRNSKKNLRSEPKVLT